MFACSGAFGMGGGFNLRIDLSHIRALGATESAIAEHGIRMPANRILAGQLPERG